MSKTFIVREVLALRARGVDVATISIRRAGPDDLLAEIDRREAERTYSVLPPRWGALLSAHGRALLSRPRRYVAALALARRLARPGLRGFVWELFYFAEAAVVWSHCRALGVTHLHVHHLNQASDAAMLAIELEGRHADGSARWTWSFTMHGPDEFADSTKYRLHEKAATARAIACVSDFARSQLMAFLPSEEWSKLRIVHCGLVPEDWTPAPTRQATPGSLRVLCVGRMVPVKGQSVLVDAAVDALDRGIDIHVVFVGDGPLRSAIEQRAREVGLGERARFLGAVGQDEIQKHYADADVVVLPSFAEGLPVVLMEAMAMGLPVIATNIAGIPELVGHGESGILVTPGRSASLADALCRLAESPALRREMGCRGHQKVAAAFDVRRSAEQLEEMFAEVLAR